MTPEQFFNGGKQVGIPASQFIGSGGFTVQGVKEKQSFGQDLVGDVKDFGTAAKSAVQERLNSVQETKKQDISGIRKAFNALGQSAGLVSDLIGQTVLGAGKAVLPQSAEDVIGSAVGGAAQKVAEAPAIQALSERYNQLKQTNPQLARDIDSALGLASLGIDLATAGVGGRVAQAGVKSVNTALDIGETGASAALKGTARIGAEVQGALTGTSAETLQQAFDAAYRGGKELTTYTRALRSQVTPEQIVNNLSDAINRVDAANSSAYSTALKQIGDNVVSTKSVKDKLIDKLGEFRVSVGPEGLDFSQSKFRLVPQARNKIEQLYKEVSAIPESDTLVGIDTTRQALRELALTGDDASARAANAIIYDTVDSIREAGKQVPGYGTELARFAEDADFLDELRRSLAAGDTATIDSTYRRLATSLKTNNERRLNLIKQLDEATGGFVLSEIAGQQLSEVLPRGMFRQIAAGVAGATALTSGSLSVISPTLIMASPRVAGEVVRALGLTAKKTEEIIKALDAARKAIDVSGLKLPLIAPTREGLSNEGQATQ